MSTNPETSPRQGGRAAGPESRNRRNSGRGRRSITIQVRVSASEKRSIEHRAAEAGMTVSSYIRKLAYAERD